MPGFIGKKIGMTSIFSADGKNIPCTVIEAGPCVVTQVKTLKQMVMKLFKLAYGERERKTLHKAMIGHFKKAKHHQKEN